MSLLFYDKYTDCFLIGVGVDLYQCSSHTMKHITKCGHVPEVPEKRRAEGPAHITGVASSEGYVAVISNNKVVELYNRQFERQAFVVATKRPTSVQLTKSNVVISDKAGDAYSYDLSLTNQKYLLGHVSVVMDTVVTRDEQYLITCDRDEKIRISHYPNCYNIDTYLLGHTDYVYRILLLSHNLLLSLGGDQKMILWDIQTQSELQRITSTHGDYTSVTSTPSDVASTPSDVTSTPSDVTSTPSDVTSTPSDVTSHYVIAGTTHNLLVYRLSDNTLTLVSELTLEHGVVSLAASNTSVMVLTREAKLELFTLSDGVLLDRRDIGGEFDLSHMVCSELPEKKKVVRTAGFTEYFERKRKRIEEETLKEEMKQIKAS